MDARIAQVSGDAIGVASVGFGQLVGDQLEGRVPLHLVPLPALAAHGPAQAIRVFEDVFQGHRLRADMAARQGIGRIALDLQDLVPRTLNSRPQMASQRLQAPKCVRSAGHGAVSLTGFVSVGEEA